MPSFCAIMEKKGSSVGMPARKLEPIMMGTKHNTLTQQSESNLTWKGNTNWKTKKKKTYNYPQTQTQIDPPIASFLYVSFWLLKGFDNSRSSVSSGLAFVVIREPCDMNCLRLFTFASDNDLGWSWQKNRLKTCLTNVRTSPSIGTVPKRELIEWWLFWRHD